jgi:hypothetical protein
MIPLWTGLGQKKEYVRHGQTHEALPFRGMFLFHEKDVSSVSGIGNRCADELHPQRRPEDTPTKSAFYAAGRARPGSRFS